MRRFRLRMLEKVNIEALLIASGQNVKRLLTFEGHRPRKLAQAAALRPPVATDHRISRARQHRSSRSWRPTKAFFNTLASLGRIAKVVTDKVIIVPYDPEWPILFARLGGALRVALGDVAVRIDHVGSTSVPGLDAKPIIDVQVSVAALEPLNAYLGPLESLGYVFRADNTERTKRYFRESPGQRRTHIHVRHAGSFSDQFALLFRDYLRAHAEDARRHAQVKYRLAEAYRHDRHGYIDAKVPHVWEIMARADRWSQEVGWEAGPTDA